ncbi:hypothetical protein EB796_007393 [Bugula neritina]|uniref:Mediator of RNA polymerase II transcription subunit 28 n=1 Tax=Bugula neritina TaxID=10212 RepID=A0A7J7K7S9_BUGNE|nr:hypothetical protein EB796_007393 [Bugula neritina]
MAEPSLKPLEPTGTIIDEFEDAFHSVCKYLDQIDDKKPQMEDIKRDADVLVSRFIDAGRTCEQYFLQKHIQIANAKPEQVLKEECNELRLEITRKDTAIERHYEKLRSWQETLSLLLLPETPI